MRLIDADVLIEAMAGACNIYDAHGIDTTVARSLITIAEKAPTVGGWISVDDETPEATEEDMEGDLTLSRFVLVFLKYKSGFTFITVDKYRPDMDAWLSEVPGEGCKVTHWMELPAPPEVDT